MNSIGKYIETEVPQTKVKYYSDIQKKLADISVRDTRVLVWTANHEHAVFDVWDEIHEAAVCVWFQELLGNPIDGTTGGVIYKFVLKDGKWQIPVDEHGNVEGGPGWIPFVNNNPFDPRKENAASNTALSVFPQNK